MASENTERASLIGGALAAIVASACCLGPFVLVTVGISGAWISNLAALEPFRPYALGVAALCMAFAYQRIYRTPFAEACKRGTLCAVVVRNNSIKYIPSPMNTHDVVHPAPISRAQQRPPPVEA